VVAASEAPGAVVAAVVLEASEAGVAPPKLKVVDETFDTPAETPNVFDLGPWQA